MLGVPSEPHQVLLNIGAGDKVFPGWISVGLGADHDVRADIRALPLPDHCADEAMAVHVLEHLDRWDAPAAMREWRRVIKPGGLLIVELPDMVKCCRNILRNPKDLRNGILGLFGDPQHRDPLMMHKWGWSESEVIEELKTAGFVKVKSAVPVFHGKRKHRDMRVEARA